MVEYTIVGQWTDFIVHVSLHQLIALYPDQNLT